jgi:hypothetical protein
MRWAKSFLLICLHCGLLAQSGPVKNWQHHSGFNPYREAHSWKNQEEQENCDKNTTNACLVVKGTFFVFSSFLQ